MSSPAAQPGTTTYSTVLRPWQQFIDLSALSLPFSFSESTYRLTQNLRYFLLNYVVLSLLIFLVTLITHPLSLLFFLCIFYAWVYLVLLRDEPLTVADFEIDERIIWAFLSVVTLGALFWSHVWSKLFVSVIIGGVIVLFHGVLRAPEDSLEDSPYGSLLNSSDSPMGEYASV